jgi:predicted tellurium resistance membrane protein TerC
MHFKFIYLVQVKNYLQFFYDFIQRILKQFEYLLVLLLALITFLTISLLLYHLMKFSASLRHLY